MILQVGFRINSSYGPEALNSNRGLVLTFPGVRHVAPYTRQLNDLHLQSLFALVLPNWKTPSGS